MRLLLLLAVMATCAWPAERPDERCAPCHKAQFQGYYGHQGKRGNTMAYALYQAKEAKILIENPKLEFQSGKYRYVVERRGGETVYQVTDGKDTISALLRYAFGHGAAGQTYVFEHQGKWYESRLSFYQTLGKLDLTMGTARTEPATLEEAAGRLMPAPDAAACFACHTTNSLRAGAVNFEAIQAGVGCENCHGNAGKHLEAVRTGSTAGLAMKKLGQWTTEEQNDACGRCHRTWADIASNGPRGIGNVRFQPYRLANSKCYDAVDPRIRCTACHDPHGPLEKTAAAYDAKCTACHSANLGKKVCRQSKTECVTCHMPKYEIPGSHHSFSDHQIRIARKNEPYPN